MNWRLLLAVLLVLFLLLAGYLLYEGNNPLDASSRNKSVNDSFNGSVQEQESPDSNQEPIPEPNTARGGPGI